MEFAKGFMFLFALLLSLLAISNAQNGPLIPDYQDIPPDTDLNILPNNSLYLRWRPQYHVLAPAGHMNDPCGLMYDPGRSVYHLFYQSFPQHVGFGNTSWSHATSPDLVSWTDVGGWENRSMVAIAAGKFPNYDWVGAFSGGAQPVNLRGEADGNLTLMYTGASRFPDNWKLPYKVGTEKQAIATSSDGGQTWQKYAGNPVIDGAPGGWNVTGLRDPIFQLLPELDEALGYEPNSHWYMTLGSGIRGVGPRMPLYSAPSNDLTSWTFLGALFEVGNNVSFSGDERSGNYGYNFELVGLFPMTKEEQWGGDGKTTTWFVTMGAEGLTSPTHPVAHWSLFSMGSISRRANGSAELTVEASGVLDWAEAYAFNQFYDPVNQRRLTTGWTDEDLNMTGTKAQGFSGSLGLMRELYVMVVHGVMPPPEGVGPAAETWTPDGRGTYTVKTLGQRPCPDVVAGIEGAATAIDVGSMSLNGRQQLESLNSTHFHLQLTVPSVPSDGSVSVHFRASADLEEHTTITYLASNGSIILDRTYSSLLPHVLKDNYIGHFRPYTRVAKQNPHASPCQITEEIQIDLFVDGSLIEVFVNDRFALTSRTYPSRADSGYVFLEANAGSGSTETDSNACAGWRDWKSSAGAVQIQNIKAWTNLLNVWPNRPLNASSPLVFDPYYETHLTFPNPYVEPGYPIYDGYKFV